MKAKTFIKLLTISYLLTTSFISCAQQPAKTGSVANLTTVDLTVAAEKSVHAVVHIKTEFERKNSVWDDFFGGGGFDDFFNFEFPSPGRKSAPLQASGSGVIITKDGYIVTNNHVVEGANKITVTLNNKREYEGKLIGTDPQTDLALIKIETNSSLPFLTFANSDQVRIGEWVLAVGNPFNLTSTVTAGIVSAKARNLNILGSSSAIESFIQTDAAVNRGNSGGALVNTNGDLIGINSAIASGTGYFTGYSFAIPSNIAKKTVNDLKEYGRVQRAFLGVALSEIDNKKADELGLKEIKGLYIGSVEDEGAAKNGGLAQGDVILEINKVEVNSISELKEFLAQHSPGDKVNIKFIRDKRTMYTDITLLSKMGKTELVKKEDIDINSFFGAKFEEITNDEKNAYQVKGGVKVTGLSDGVLKRSGVKEGYIITSINKSAVNTVADIVSVISGNNDEYISFEGFYNNSHYRFFYTIQMP